MIGAMVLGVLACVAQATPNFPPDMKAYLGASTEAACAVCHQDGVTALGTVTTPFGTAMKARGLQAIDVDTLHTALDRMDADAVDSDGDGVTDVEEIITGDDPNVAAPGGGGCSTADGARWAGFGAIAVGLGRRGRRHVDGPAPQAAKEPSR